VRGLNVDSAGSSTKTKSLRRRVLGHRHRHGRIIQPAKEQVSSLDPAGTRSRRALPAPVPLSASPALEQGSAHLSPSAPMDRASRKDRRTSSNDSFLPGQPSPKQQAKIHWAWALGVASCSACSDAIMLTIVVQTLASSEPRTSSGAQSDLQINKPPCSS